MKRLVNGVVVEMSTREEDAMKADWARNSVSKSDDLLALRAKEMKKAALKIKLNLTDEEAILLREGL